MIGFNHALAGGLIGALLPMPIAAPLAVASHFTLDSLPHYGIPYAHRDQSKLWRPLFIADFLITAALIAVPVSQHRYDILACGALAVAPDFVWVAQVLKSKSFHLDVNSNWYTRWHARIQRYERPWGIYVEVPVACLLSVLLWMVFRNR